MDLFSELRRIGDRPAPFAEYTTPRLWNDPHISKSMLEAHLNPGGDAASFRPERIDRCVEWSAERFAIGAGTRLCDLGCGPGLWTRRWAGLGARVTGVDLSERSITHARDSAEEQGAGIRYLLCNYLDLPLHEVGTGFNLVTLVYGDFSVLSPPQRQKLLATCRAVLQPGGHLLLDVASAARWQRAHENSSYAFHAEGGFFSPWPHHLFSQTFKYEAEKLLCDKYTVVEQRRRFALYNWNQCYTPETLRTALQAGGFDTEELFSGLAGEPYCGDADWIAAVARRAN